MHDSVAEHGRAGARAARVGDWLTAIAHFTRCVEICPTDERGIRCLAMAQSRKRLATVDAKGDKTNVAFRCRVKGVKLMPHEQWLAESGQLRDITHAGSSAVWLQAPSTVVSDVTGMTTVYRPMGDRELVCLLRHGVLPDTQPYQTIVEGAAGRAYAERYLRGSKWVDSSPTTVVEFTCPAALIRRLFSMQCKPEDGCLSHGLGDKGGKGLPVFNESLMSGESTFRLVLVKRSSSRKDTKH